MAKAQVTWVGPGMRMLGEVEGGPTIIIDSPKPPYGTHSGPSPMELLLMGLGGCTAMDVISIMGKKRQPLSDLQVKVEATRREEHPQIYTQIHLEYVAYGTGIDPQSLERAIELSESKYCSVSAMLGQAAKITTSFRIVEAPGPHTIGAGLPTE